MTIGGLNVGVTPLDMAHAYETIAHGGDRVSGSLASDFQPVGIQEVDAGGRTLPDGHHHDVNDVTSSACCPRVWRRRRPRCSRRCLPTARRRPRRSDSSRREDGHDLQLRRRVVRGLEQEVHGRGVGRVPDKLVPMTTEFGGKPVFGGTYPALIWHDFMLAAMGVEAARANHVKPGSGTTEGGGVPSESSSPTAEESGARPPAARSTPPKAAKPRARRQARRRRSGRRSQRGEHRPRRPPRHRRPPQRPRRPRRASARRRASPSPRRRRIRTAAHRRRERPTSGTRSTALAKPASRGQGRETWCCRRDRSAKEDRRPW